MLKRALSICVTLFVIFPAILLAKPKTKVYNNTASQVFDAALRTARERHVVTFTDEKNLMFTFQTGNSAFSYGFIANASVETDGDKTKLIINVQHKNDGKNASFSFNAGDRMADKFFEQVGEELSRDSKQPTAQKAENAHVDVPANAGIAKQATPVQVTGGNTGNVSIVSNPDGGDISVDGAFVGNAPASLDLAAGKHTISVSESGYTTWTKELMVMAGSKVNLKAALLK